MKRKVVTIKSDPKAQGVWCITNGSIMEITTSHLALTDNIIDVLKTQEGGKNILKSLLKDTIKRFEKSGISLENMESNNERSNNN